MQPSQQSEIHSNWLVIICLLGNFRILVSGQPMPLHKARKVECLLSTLSLRAQSSVPRNTLLDILWLCAKRSLAGQSLKSLIRRLRKLFQPWLDDVTQFSMKIAVTAST
jgi:DNA-binding SARP family transcriptional activator